MENQATDLITKKLTKKQQAEQDAITKQQAEQLEKDLQAEQANKPESQLANIDKPETPMENLGPAPTFESVKAKFNISLNGNMELLNGQTVNAEEIELFILSNEAFKTSATASNAYAIYYAGTVNGGNCLEKVKKDLSEKMSKSALSNIVQDAKRVVPLAIQGKFVQPLSLLKDAMGAFKNEQGNPAIDGNGVYQYDAMDAIGKAVWDALKADKIGENRVTQLGIRDLRKSIEAEQDAKRLKDIQKPADEKPADETSDESDESDETSEKPAEKPAEQKPASQPAEKPVDNKKLTPDEMLAVGQLLKLKEIANTIKKVGWSPDELKAGAAAWCAIGRAMGWQ